MQILIIGGAGFIGSNVASYYCKKGSTVIIFDNISRNKIHHNIAWLKKEFSSQITFCKGDIRTDISLLAELMEKVDVVFHLAGQVAVTTSVQNPIEDAHINIMGTLNVLEAIRKSQRKPIVLYSSTNKVYGQMHDIPLEETEEQWVYKDKPFGISEDQPLDFHSPYGCSKGAADQYVRDYARIYNLKTIVFRQSCIYGKRQFGSVDQGWVSWVILRSLFNKPITIFGDGKQIRDILYVDDLCEAYHAAVMNSAKTAGNIYNIGGGYQNTVSLLQLIKLLKNILQKDIHYSFSEWRPGDQRVFVSDIRKAYTDFQWKPKVSSEEGVKNLVQWVNENKGLFVQ